MNYVYDEMIKSENTDDCFEMWSGYRRFLTDYIIGCCKGSDVFAPGTEQIHKPSLAIWGAGACNDIDLAELDKYFSLTLIDRDIEAMGRALARYGLSNVKCVDLGFWSISDEEYRHIEELLADRAHEDADSRAYDTISELIQYLDDIADREVSKVNRVIYEGNISDTADGRARRDNCLQFDFSVAAGLSSQLCSRIAALCHIYAGHFNERERRQLACAVDDAGTVAVSCMLTAMKRTTAGKLLLSYERGIVEEGVEKPLFISGNYQLEKILSDWEKTGKTAGIFNRCACRWDFTEEKSYIMNLQCCNLR